MKVGYSCPVYSFPNEAVLRDLELATRKPTHHHHLCPRLSNTRNERALSTLIICLYGQHSIPPHVIRRHFGHV